MRKLSLLSRMRTCGRRRPLSGPIPCNATVRILLWAHPSATPAPGNFPQEKGNLLILAHGKHSSGMCTKPLHESLELI